MAYSLAGENVAYDLEHRHHCARTGALDLAAHRACRHRLHRNIARAQRFTRSVRPARRTALAGAVPHQRSARPPPAVCNRGARTCSPRASARHHPGARGLSRGLMVLGAAVVRPFWHRMELESYWAVAVRPTNRVPAAGSRGHRVGAAQRAAVARGNLRGAADGRLNPRRWDFRDQRYALRLLAGTPRSITTCAS